MSVTKQRKKYTEEFKTEAVRLVLESGKSIAEVARNLGISANLLYRWRTEEHRAVSTGTTRSALKAERKVRGCRKSVHSSTKKIAGTTPPICPRRG